MPVRPHDLELVVSLGILLLSVGLGTLTYLTWRRERERRLAIVTVAYVLFALRGLAVVLEETFLMSVRPELIDHLSSLFVLLGLLLFFVAIARD
ncbi:hypothetical protein ZOD2009_07059 [Haladaptatus paucihalophilus DX253]|uniref:Uncharacterized protein n=1 Tax=Haladaptatus paucihalophilus DX253 TaxID=797209 RepID=E7QRI9_HALPU|nr:MULTISPECIES: hypothetical protein [Haladaptatus]EFW92608.1 hypothetical protein ZOD2009_07059 [Haladaptatus paucihalophilus DX253]ODR79676.1 hypothetical protein BG842_08450 [Haladaptatus sp. W1]GKZ13791.1 hypothetical protein HAL_16720 [Haladaptatus sp. T7]SHK17784.1 hypothetical protein SAMN05444342_0849 [Haladaptatus paucihalophilus DX253]